MDEAFTRREAMLAGGAGLSTLAAGLLPLSETAANVELSDEPVIRALQENVDHVEYPPGARQFVRNGGEWLATRIWGSPGVRRTGGPHNGIDFKAPYGEVIIAAASGRAIFVEDKGGYRSYGKRINIVHSKKYIHPDSQGQYKIATAYGHLSKSYLAGDGGNWVDVTRGQPIGEVGHSGTIRPHLHWSALAFDKQADSWHWINPLQLLADGPGNVTCFDENRSHSRFQIQLTWPFPCGS
jgi:murein DD-endopeptidase MepM/ murein hydrolase activator NlpD